jgi:hypothetical protein
MYGPKVSYSIEDWVERLNLIEKRKWVKNFMLNEKHDYEVPYDSDDEEGIHIVFSQEFSDDIAFSLMLDFLEKHQLTVGFDNNRWDYPFIGMKVEDYNSFSNEFKNRVEDFCDVYNLQKPTFYAVINGE